MLDGTEKMFANYESMMFKLKTKQYEERFEIFMNKNRDTLEEMFDYIKGREDADTAASEIASVFVKNVVSEHKKFGRLWGNTKQDLSMYMIYFVFPAILNCDNNYSNLLADAIRNEWRSATSNPKFEYTDYKNIHDNFQEKLFGVF